MPITSLLKDPTFARLSPEAKVIAGKMEMEEQDPSFAALSEPAKLLIVRQELNIPSMPTPVAPVQAPAPAQFQMPPGSRPTATDIITTNPLKTVGRVVKGGMKEIPQIGKALWPLISNQISPQDILEAGKSLGGMVFNGKYGTTHGTPETGRQVKAMAEKNFGTPGAAAGTVNQFGGDILNSIIDNPIKSYLGPKVLGKVLPEIATLGAEAKVKRIDSLIEAEKRRGLSKGLRPNARGKKTTADLDRWYQDSGRGVEDIIKNKDKVSLADDVGNIESGVVPQTVQQMGEAISQRKRTLYPQFHSILAEAGKISPMVDNKPIIDALTQLAKNEALKVDAPEALEYAKELAARLRASNNYTSKMAIEDVEESIMIKNRRLDDFYRTKDFKEGQKAYVDALVTNMQRKQVDDIIEKMDITGVQKIKYDELKKTYGSFKGMENEVGRRARTVAGNPPKGIMDFSDIFTTPMAVHGMLTMNPALVGSGFLAKSIAHYYKWTNAADTIIAKMFKNTEKLMEDRAFFQSKVDIINARKAARGGKGSVPSTPPSPGRGASTPPSAMTSPMVSMPSQGITVPGSTFTGAPIPPPPVKMPYTQALIDAQEEPARRMYPTYQKKR